MADINVAELRQNLPAYLAKVRQGARVGVTSRGKVIAEIVPPSVDEATQAAVRARLRGSVMRYELPLDSVLPADEWDMNR
jgi:prevent-host-death family protein